MKKDIIIDGDIIIHLVCNSRAYQSDLDGCSLRGSKKEDLTKYKDHYKQIVRDWVTIAEVESICYGWVLGETKVIISGKENFRYDIYPEYKKDRKPSTGLMKRLKKWARKYYIEAVGCEADDVIAYYVRKGALGFSFDKDLIYGVKGRWFDVYYDRQYWVNTTAHEAEHFFKKQVLAGDDVDGIPSLAGIRLIKAEKLLRKYGDSWDTILEIFKNPNLIPSAKGSPRAESYTKKYMVTMTRLVCMSQWTPKKGIKLWKFPK